MRIAAIPVTDSRGRGGMCFEFLRRAGRALLCASDGRVLPSQRGSSRRSRVRGSSAVHSRRRRRSWARPRLR